MGRFDERATRPARGFSDILRWKLLGSPPRDRTHFVTPRRAPDLAAIAGAPSITWVGHATFVLRLGGRLVATDPVWSTRIFSGTGPRRATAPGVALESLPPIDLVLVTHDHYDHLDLPSLRQIGPRARYVVPLGNGPRLTRIGLTDVVELDWWGSHRIGDLEVTLVPSRHWSMRMPWSRNETLWGGYVVRGPEGTAYHAGDTALFDGFVEIGRRLGPIDWAMLPIGAYAPRWFMEPQHMDPDDAIQAWERLAARHFVAMHWGTFKLTDEPLGEPPARLSAAWAERGHDPRLLWIPDVGETRRL